MVRVGVPGEARRSIGVHRRDDSNCHPRSSERHWLSRQKFIRFAIVSRLLFRDCPNVKRQIHPPKGSFACAFFAALAHDVHPASVLFGARTFVRPYGLFVCFVCLIVCLLVRLFVCLFVYLLVCLFLCLLCAFVCVFIREPKSTTTWWQLDGSAGTSPKLRGTCS